MKLANRPLYFTASRSLEFGRFLATAERSKRIAQAFRHPIKIRGVEDHVHVFCSLSKHIAFSDLIGRLKGASSKRLKQKGLQDFGWQNGYGAFSVSESNVESVTA